VDDARQAQIKRRFDALTGCDWEKFRADLNGSLKLCEALRDDFVHALNDMVDRGQQQYDFRNIVRCFGSLLDGVTSSMRFAAVALCKVYGEPLNPFLTDKTAEQRLSTHQRIYSIYRLLADFLPKSPLAHIPDARWDKLRFALEIRNRITHPSVLSDLDISKKQIMMVMETGHDFFRDFSQFVLWFSQKEQRMWMDLPGTRRRYIAKINRNDPCPCKSGKKFKNCCWISQAG
jgi:hypothetical protein